MTVRQKMHKILSHDNKLLDAGEYILEHRPHGVIQNFTNSKILVVSKSKDDIDEDDNAIIVEIEYANLKDYFNNYPPNY